MTTTSPVVSFGLYALEVKQDSSFSCADLQSFSKLADLKNDNATSVAFASYEPDFWLLDGGYKFKPVSDTLVHVGLMSASMSDENGNFATSPVLTVDFSTAHSSDGLTLRFSQYSGDYASVVQVDYYDAVAALIRSDTYYPSSWELATGQAVDDFKQIVITFGGTNRPYRYLRLTGIDFGTLIYFTGSDVREASVIEEIDPTSGEARYNSLSLRLYSEEATFNPLNPSGVYQYLQERQPIAVHETVGNQTVFMGLFYVDKWKNTSEKQIEFSCIDALGVLDTMTYLGGYWTGSDVEDVIDAIMTAANLPYDLDSSLNGIQIKGWLPICTYREALQQIALAIGAYLDCSRSSSLKIYAIPMASTGTAITTITAAMKAAKNQPTDLKPLITGVEVTAHAYSTTTTTVTLYSGTLSAGTYTVTWSEPRHTLAATNATIVSSGANHAVISVASTLAVTLTGRTYTDSKQTYAVNTAGLPAGTKQNILKVNECTLINPDNMAAVCQRIYDYYQQRLTQEFRLFAPTTVKPGDIVLIDTLFGQQVKAVIEKMSINLSGGMVANVEATGVLNV